MGVYFNVELYYSFYVYGEQQHSSSPVWLIKLSVMIDN